MHCKGRSWPAVTKGQSPCRHNTSGVLVPPTVAEPRGSRWSARNALRLMHLGEAVWHALEQIGRRRASGELARNAPLHESSEPALARWLSGISGVGKTNGAVKE